jgi:hypothetical protein
MHRQRFLVNLHRFALLASHQIIEIVQFCNLWINSQCLRRPFWADCLHSPLDLSTLLQPRGKVTVVQTSF